MTVALIDADVVVHMSAFAAQRNVYFVVEDVAKSFSTREVGEFVSREEAKEYLLYQQEKDKDGQYVLRKEVISESAEHAEICARQIMMKILGDTKATNYKLFLTSEDKSNFRYKIAKTKPYKGNRLKSLCCNSTVRQKMHIYVCKKCDKVCDLLDTKPVHYHHIRNYLHLFWDGYVVIGEEADDYLGIEQCRYFNTDIDGVNGVAEETIICSIDKDLKMIPGWHYNIKTGEKEFVNAEEAMRFFWKQMLMGDTVDNIQGVPKFGKIKAGKLIDNSETLGECREKVIEEYKKYYKDEWTDKFLEMGNLLWIKREPNIIFEDLNLCS